MGELTEADLERCACARCPSCVQGDTKLFCLHGKSEKGVEERGCMCRTCPVHVENRLEGRAYCLRGNPEEQSA